jgi:pimeloyl-ACP methyl ester carboxylesterase
MNRRLLRGLLFAGVALLLLVNVCMVAVVVVQATGNRLNARQGTLVSRSDPAGSYEAAEARIRAWQAEDKAQPVNPDCPAIFLSHGRKTDRVVLLIHGYTSCPRSFYELGELYHQQGYNVLIARMPRHGLVDRMNEDIAGLKAEELVAYVDRVVDIGAGLGDEVVVLGLSAGGVLTGFAAQYRDEVDLAVLVAPVFGYRDIPHAITPQVVNTAMSLPNRWMWWDPEKKEAMPPPYAYPRFSTHGLGEIMLVADNVRAAAQVAPPRAGHIIMVSNAADKRVGQPAIDELVADWQASGYQPLDTYTFPAELELIHGLIDPRADKQKVHLVYPVLLELVANN